MGEVFVSARIGKPGSRKTRKIEFLADTGATVPVIPEDILTSLAIRPIDKDAFELADGKSRMFRLGEATIELNGKRRTFTVAFGARKSQPLLGLVVLETFGFRVDPVSKSLVKRRLMMYHGDLFHVTTRGRSWRHMSSKERGL